MAIREFARFILPASVYAGMRSLYRTARSRWRAARRGASPRLNQDDLVSAWRTGGLSAGDIVMVHSSLSRLGNIDGGAETVIQSLLDVVMRDGTVLMPCYGSAAEVQKSMAEGRFTDLRTSRPVTGKITDLFRTWPGVIRSSHPFSSVCALGAEADFFTSGHAADSQVCHAESPIGRLVERDAKIVGIGVPLSVGLAVAHYLEDTYPDFPFEVHAPPFRVRYIDASGATVERDIVRYDPVVAAKRIDQAPDGWILRAFTEHFTNAGILRWFDFGRTRGWVMNARPLFNELRRLADKGITMYLTRDEWTAMNGGDANTSAW